MEKEEAVEHKAKDTGVASALSDFVLSLIQAFLKTGYYRSDHPEAQKARLGLYESLQKFLVGKREISFIAAGEGGKPEIFIGGILDEPVAGSGIMMKGMSEIFIPKFLEYFERKHLSSFAMKTAISEDEFEKFISIMTESPLNERDTDVQEKLTMDLIKQEVLMVSTVFNVDIVGKNRKLPWRVELSISRLKRDLNLIPLFRSISEDKKNEIRKTVFEDIIRPLRSAPLMQELLENLDLISGDLVGIEPEDFETKIVEHLDERLLPDVSRGILINISGVAKAFDKLKEKELLVRLEYLKRIARRIGKKLLDLRVADETLFIEFVRCNILTMDEIQGSVRDMIATRLSFDSFLDSPRKFFDGIKETKDAEELKKRFGMLFDFLPSLFASGRYAEIREIYALYGKKAPDCWIHDNPDRVAGISREANRVAESAGKEEVSELLDVLSLSTEAGTPALVDMIVNRNRFARRYAIELLKRKGPVIIPFVLAGFAKKEGWYYLRNALTLLSIEGGGPEIEAIFKQSLSHPEANVRKEAARGIITVMGERAGDLLLPLLRDENPDVRVRTISSLAAIGCISPEVLSFLVNVLSNRTEENNTVLDAVLNALSDAHIPRGREQQLEDALLELLKDSFMLGFLRKRAEQDTRTKQGAIKALGAFGSSRSVKTLKKYASDKDPVIGKTASDALKRIEEAC